MPKCKDCIYLVTKDGQKSTKWVKCRQGNYVNWKVRSCHKFVIKNKAKKSGTVRTAKKLRRKL